MSDSPLLQRSVRKEVQNFMQSCEQLLTSGLKPNGAPLSQEEVQMVEAYMFEVKKLLNQSAYQRS